MTRPQLVLSSSGVILYRKPDTIGICVVLMPWIAKSDVVFNATEGNRRRMPRAQEDLFIKRGIILSFKLLQSAMTIDLRMDLDKVMFVVNKTIGLRGGKPKVDFKQKLALLFWGRCLAEDDRRVPLD